MSDPVIFTAETNILQAMTCAQCGGEPPKKPGEKCARCGGKGTEAAVIEIFRNFGMRCWKKDDDEPCIATEVETLTEAALYHEMELGKLLDALNALKIPAKKAP